MIKVNTSLNSMNEARKATKPSAPLNDTLSKFYESAQSLKEISDGIYGTRAVSLKGDAESDGTIWVEIIEVQALKMFQAQIVSYRIPVTAGVSEFNDGTRMKGYQKQVYINELMKTDWLNSAQEVMKVATQQLFEESYNARKLKYPNSIAYDSAADYHKSFENFIKSVFKGVKFVGTVGR